MGFAWVLRHAVLTAVALVMEPKDILSSLLLQSDIYSRH